MKLIAIIIPSYSKYFKEFQNCVLTVMEVFYFMNIILTASYTFAFLQNFCENTCCY